LKRVVAKAGQGSEEGVCFEHFIVDSKDVEKWKSGKVEK
jgi:hypothetical protein